MTRPPAETLSSAAAPVRLTSAGSVAVNTLNRPDAHKVLDITTSQVLMACAAATQASAWRDRSPSVSPQRPVQTGLRLSLKAARPSFASSVIASRAI